ncbi:hypothetical protein HCN44_010635 [Aphidius gifuensis]|uniref:Uncharacterized protein n=1 Tax=Aphidius gifuensis TaxID=684658 RepID=A0A835CQJ2_APHGI|nr:protein PFC0760c-like [Aphidius gifuensis]KAF7991834.1 hypothetical protein HCN44_010635 [Aphidius gifuensis]
MPGIHVRTSSQTDWNKHEKDQALTVPGSYWLCHKKTIFKFTFKYPKYNRNVKKKFQHDKELMKVIRRIIKSQPISKQGQQFGTRHLLVTYNHRPWDRQDKIFAKLKFDEKPNVTVYHNEFFLTVKILLVDLRPDNRRDFVDGLIVYGDKTNDTIIIDQNSTTNSSLDDLSNDNLNISIDKNNDEEKITDSSVTIYGDLDNSPLDQSESEVPIEIDSSLSSPLNDMQETIDMPYQYLIERDIEKSKTLNKRKCTVGTNYNSIPSTFIIPDEKITHEKCETIVSSFGNNNGQTNIDNIIDTTNESKDKKCDKIKPPPLILQNDNNNFKNISNELNKIIKLPIDIEEKMKSPIKINEMTPIKSPSSFFKLTSTPTQSPLSKNHSISNLIDQITPKSANITDLVMEGLMFTIRQDKDSLTVVEQKTKLEPDEVLENSEKIETQEGAECLVNSSLLKLENLITKIDKSNSNNSNNKNKIKSNNLPCSYFGQNIDNHNYNDDYLNNKNNNSNVVLLNRMSKSEVDEFFSLAKKNVYPDETKNKSIDSISMDVDDSKSESGEVIDSKSESAKSIDSMPMDVEYIYPDFKDDCPKEVEKNNKKQKKIKGRNVKSTDDSDTDVIDDEDDDDNDDVNKNDKTGNESDTPSMADEDIIPEALQNKIDINHDESNLLMDDHDDGDEEEEENYYTPPDVSFKSKKLKAKSPRIVSNEVVSFDLSTLRSVKSNRKSTDTDKSNDADKSNDTDKSNDSDDKTTPEDSNVQTDDEKINSDDTKIIHEEVNDDNKNTNSDELKMLDDNSKIEDEKKIENTEILKDTKLDDKKITNDKEKLIINTKKLDDLNANDKSPDNTNSIIKMEIDNDTKSSNSYNKRSRKKSPVVPRLTRKSLSMKRKLEELNKNDQPRKDVEIEMWKFLQDMSRGVRVVVKRLDLSDMSNIVAKNCIK